VLYFLFGLAAAKLSKVETKRYLPGIEKEYGLPKGLIAPELVKAEKGLSTDLFKRLLKELREAKSSRVERLRYVPSLLAFALVSQLMLYLSQTGSTGCSYGYPTAMSSASSVSLSKTKRERRVSRELARDYRSTAG
jgi:hypothetical protein